MLLFADDQRRDRESKQRGRPSTASRSFPRTIPVGLMGQAGTTAANSNTTGFGTLLVTSSTRPRVIRPFIFQLRRGIRGHPDEHRERRGGLQTGREVPRYGRRRPGAKHRSRALAARVTPSNTDLSNPANYGAVRLPRCARSRPTADSRSARSSSRNGTFLLVPPGARRSRATTAPLRVHGWDRRQLGSLNPRTSGRNSARPHRQLKFLA